MKKILLTVVMAIGLSVGFAANVPAQTAALQADLAKSFSRVSVVKLNAAQVRESRTLGLTLDVQAVKINLEPNDLRSAELQKSEGFKVINTYKGKIAGEAFSTVRVNFIPTGIEAVILRNGETFYAQPASVFSDKSETGDTVVYNPKNRVAGERMLIDNISNSISRTMSNLKKAAPQNFYLNANFTTVNVTRLRRRTPFSPIKTLQLHIYSDREWLVYYGSDITASMNAVDAQLNAAEAVYENEIGITFSIIKYSLWRKANIEDNYTTAGNLMNDDLDRFRPYNLADPFMTGEDAAILFTNVTYSAARGYGYPGGACGTYDQAIVGRQPFGSAAGFVTAHEIGHLLGANHTPATTDPAWYDKIMEDTGLSNFSQMTFYSGSVLEIQDFVTNGQGASCVN